MIDGETRAPPLLSEADLIGLMDKYGIGLMFGIEQMITTIMMRTWVLFPNVISPLRKWLLKVTHKDLSINYFCYA